MLRLVPPPPPPTRIPFNCSISFSTIAYRNGAKINTCAPREQQQPHASVSKFYCVYCVERRQQPFTSHWHSCFGSDTRTADELAALGRHEAAAHHRRATGVAEALPPSAGCADCTSRGRLSPNLLAAAGAAANGITAGGGLGCATTVYLVTMLHKTLRGGT
jgi:hypothetical protein